MKWSDGAPAGIDDFLFWWNDMVMATANRAIPPRTLPSSPARWSRLPAVDDYTLKLNYVAPAPHTAIRLANWSKSGNGSRWIVPSAYLKQFHPKYNTADKDFAELNNKTDVAKQPRVSRPDRLDPGED